MNYELLIAAEQLQELLANKAAVRIFDCTFDLADVAAGHQQFLDSHIPGAVYAHLDTALSDKHGTGENIQSRPVAASGGRHPLPSREKLATWLSGVGLANDMQAVVYDRNGANYCGRLWWMLKWVGHAKVAVLDGGLQAWRAAEGPVTRGTEPAHFQTGFKITSELAKLTNTKTVAENLGRPIQTLIDARGEPRFRGEVEPLDPIAGHIPGALNRPFSQNLASDGRFKPAQQLRNEFETLLAGRDATTVVHHCGSGVSAAPNILAMQIAGFGMTGLYAGSWSEWCSDSSRPMAQG